MPNFDEAIRQTEEMFANERAEQEVVPPVEEEAPPTEEIPAETEEIPTEEVPQDATEATINDAIQTAEMAAQTAQEKDSQLQQVMAELEALKQQNQQLQGTLDEMSRQNEEKLIEEAMLPPELDFDGLAFADEETRKAEMAKYAEAMSEYNRKHIMQELAPTLEYAKKGMQEAEKTEVIENLSQVPELSGIKEALPQLDRIIANNKWLQSGDMSTEEKYINAYAIARGVNAINTPPEPPKKELTSEELMELYDKNPTFQELVEKKRIEAIKNSQQVPPFSASSGAVNAALNIKEKPKTMEEASEATRKMWGLV
jgi:hypothetical protein